LTIVARANPEVTSTNRQSTCGLCEGAKQKDHPDANFPKETLPVRDNRECGGAGIVDAPGRFRPEHDFCNQEQPPLVQLSETRGEMVLNGLWRFMPGQGPAAQAPTAGAGA
jgi:hypothetical protein